MFQSNHMKIFGRFTMTNLLTDSHFWLGFCVCGALIFLLSYIALAFSSENMGVKTRNFILDFQIKKRKQFATKLKKKADEHCEGK